MKSYRFYGDEMEILGQRLDAARRALANSTTAWSKCHWARVVEQLRFQWQQLPILHDGDAQMTIIPRWTVSYDYYERQQEGNLYGTSDRIFDAVFRKNADLTASWENHRAQRLAKAQ